MLLPKCGISETTMRSKKTEQEVGRKCLDVRLSCIFLATGERWEGNALSDLRQQKT